MEVNYRKVIAKVGKINENEKSIENPVFCLSFFPMPSFIFCLLLSSCVFFDCKVIVTPKEIQVFNFKNSVATCSLIPLPPLFVLFPCLRLENIYHE